ncbi:MAG: maturation protein [Guiyang fiers-like virus 2]|nr:MAG: maturation protein [Guiyang fiers-like virus 2]
MPYLPKPPKGTERLSVSESFTIQLYDYARDGRLLGVYPRSGGLQDTQWSLVRNRSSNKPRQLAGGGIWKSCSDYVRSTCTVDYLHGEYTTRFSTAPFGTYYRRVGKTNQDFQSEFGPFIRPTDWTCYPMPSNIKTRLDTELLNKVASRKASYGESLAESVKTFDHLAKTTSSLARAYMAARKGRFGEVARHLGVQKRSLKNGTSVADRWLEYSYGWVPLMNDIYSSYQLLQKGFRKNTHILSSQRTLRDSHTARGNEEEAFRTNTYGGSEVAYKAKLYYSVKRSYLSQMDEAGLLNPLEVAWALVPFSFVVDWFMPIGNALAAYTARAGVDFIDGYYGTRVSAAYTTAPRYRLEGGEVFVSTSMSTRSEGLAYTRTFMSGFPLPGLYIKSPFSTNHTLSALALVRSLTR